jgi:hypothetical protein
MTTCEFCNQRIPIEGCAEHVATCGLDAETLALIEASDEVDQ